MNYGRYCLRRFGRRRVLVATLAAALGCSSSSSDTVDAPVDAGADAADAEPVDAGAPEASPPADAATCDIGPAPPGTTPLVGSFALLDDAGAGPQVPSGGDPKGEWLITKATFWISESAASMFDKDASKVEGTAWAVVTDTEIRLDFDLTTTLAGTAAGTVVRPSRIATSGTYAVSGARVVINPVCSLSSGPSGAAAPDLEFTSDADGGTGFFVTRSSGQAGTVTVVWEGTRRNSQ
jgi:hypothetical protein